MGHIIMPAFAFRTALSEDAGVRSGFALTEANMLAHLPVENALRESLESDNVLRVQSEDYAETVVVLGIVGAAAMRRLNPDQAAQAVDEALRVREF